MTDEEKHPRKRLSANSVEHHFAESAAEDMRDATRRIDLNASSRECVNAAVFAAIGTEKLLKSLLARVNPAFILAKDNFDNVMSEMYSDQIHDASDRDRIIKGGHANVITLRTAIERAANFYPEVKEIAPILHRLAAIRDIALHRTTFELDLPSVEKLVKRDLLPTLKEIASLTEPTRIVWDEESKRIGLLSAVVKIRDERAARIGALLLEAADAWHRRATDAHAVSLATRRTNEDLEDGHLTTSCVCPACENKAVVFLDVNYETDWDDDDGRPYLVPSGVYPTQLECHFCGLSLTEYDEFMHVGLDQRISEGYKDE